MHRALAAWLVERPWHAAVACGICGALSFLLPFMLLACAIPVLVALRVNVKLGLALALLTSVPWISVPASAPVLWVLSAAAVFFGPVMLAILLRRTGSMNLCFQLATLMCGLIVVAIHVFGPDPVKYWMNLIHEAFAASGVEPDANWQTLMQQFGASMWGLLASAVLAGVLGALFLGRWWAGLTGSGVEFGAEFRSLRLGTVLGAIVTGVLVAMLFSNSPLVRSLLWVACSVLTLQGLAAAHRSKANGHLSQGRLTAIYVLLVVPISTSITALVLAVWGYADNWLRPRAHSA
jgi:hypothetical protein